MILQADTLLFSEGDPGHSMFLIRRGSVRVSRKEGTEQKILADLGPGSIVGEMSLLDGCSRSATVTTLAETEFVEIDRVLLDRMFANLPTWFSAIAKVLVGRLRATTAKRHGSDLRGSVPVFLHLLLHPPSGGWSAGTLCATVREIYGLSLPEARAVLGALSTLGLARIQGNRVLPESAAVESCYDRILARSSPFSWRRSDPATYDFAFHPDDPPSSVGGVESLYRAWEGSDSEFEALVAPHR